MRLGPSTFIRKVPNEQAALEHFPAPSPPYLGLLVTELRGVVAERQLDHVTPLVQVVVGRVPQAADQQL